MRSWVAIEGDFSDTVGSGKGGCDFEVEVELDRLVVVVVSTGEQEHKERARPQSYAHATCESPRGERQGGAPEAGRGGHDHLDQRADHLGYGPVCGQREAGQGVCFDRGTTWETGKRRDGL